MGALVGNQHPALEALAEPCLRAVLAGAASFKVKDILQVLDLWQADISDSLAVMQFKTWISPW